tara:strand:+ start:161 stop:1129 length:969 start_codon:yes stop_codon:yes gene_type:complete
MKAYILNIPVIKFSIYAFLSSFIFITFFTSPVYKSESVIDVSSNQAESFASSFTSSFLPSVSSNDAYQVMLYLESNEASNLLRKEYNIVDFFKRDHVSFFSKYKETRFNNFHEYFKNKLSIKTDGESSTLTISTYAFSPEDAKSFNLSLVDITANFFNRKTRLAAINSRSGKICELFLTNSGVIDLATNDLNIKPLIEINEVNSLNELLINKAENFKDYCINKINSTDDTEALSDQGPLNIPAFEMRSINVEASKNIITKIYEDSMGVISEAEYIDVIVEPVIPDNEESKMAILKALIIFFVTYLLIVTLKISIRLTDEFDI